MFSRLVLSKLFLLLVSLLSLAASPLAHAAEQEPQLWTLVTGVAKLSERWRLYGEAQPRLSLEQAHVERLLLRTALGYQVSEPLSLWAGYGWTPLLSPAFGDEQRPFLQSQLVHMPGRLTLLNRTRFESRFIEGTDGASFRVRHMLRAVLPLDAQRAWGIAAYDELFVNVNSLAVGPQAGLDQNRAFLGLNRVLSPLLTVEMGYLFNYLWRPTAREDRVLHTVVLWLAFTP